MTYYPALAPGFRSNYAHVLPTIGFVVHVQLLDIVKDPHSRTPSLIFEYVENTDFKVRGRDPERGGAGGSMTGQEGA